MNTLAGNYTQSIDFCENDVDIPVEEEFDDDFAFALKLAKEEELRFNQQKELEKRDAELARKLQEEQAQQSRTTTTQQRPVARPTNNNRTHTDPKAEQIARDEALAREKQSLYTCNFFGGNNSVTEQIARDEALAREKQSLYTAVPFTSVRDQIARDEAIAREKQSLYTAMPFSSVREQIANDETIARAKQSLYTEAFSAPQTRSQQPTLVQQSPPAQQPPSQVRQSPSQSQPQAPPDLSASQMNRNFENQLNSAADNIGDELSQLRLDEQVATDRQSAYTAQLGQMFRQMDRDEAIARRMKKEDEEKEKDGSRHQISIHNMHCNCGDTSNMDHTWSVHDAHCGCKTTMQVVLPVLGN